ncbi:MAG: tetratricopeptide repeat protein, partial [Thermodesulfobacteriota bacterium]
LSLLIAFLLYKLFNVKNFQTVSIGLFCAIFLVFGFLTVLRQSVWHDRVTFWADAAKNTDNSIPLINYGMALIDNNKFDEGIDILKTGLRTDKKSSKLLRAAALNNMGIGYMKLGQGKKAEETFNDAIKEDKYFYKSYYHLGIIYYVTGKRQNSQQILELSKDYFSKAISFKKNYARAYLGIARIYVELGNINIAKEFAGKALGYGLTAPLDQQAVKILKSN